MSANSLPPNGLPVSFYLFKQCKLWVWDFDDTLINTEAYLRRDMKTNTIRNLKDSELDVDFPQWRYFKKLIEYLTTHGKYVGIASFGTYEIIRAYMDRIFGFNQKYFTKQNIIAPCLQDRDNRSFSIPPNKNEYIYQLMKIYRVQDFGRVVLFDDLPSNIASATSIGVIAVQIATPRNGDIDGSKMYFGPWIMGDLDNKLEKSCCQSIKSSDDNIDFVNNSKAPLKTRKYNSEVNDKVNGSGNNDCDDCDGVAVGNGEAVENGFYGDRFPYQKSAIGTGIGDRKISKKPEMRWNKMNVDKPPIWQNGNWQTDGGSMTMESFPETSLGGYSLNFWENDQSVIDKNISNQCNTYKNRNRNRNRNNDNKSRNDIIEENMFNENNVKYKNIYNSYESIKEGFESGDSNIKKVSNYNDKYRKDNFSDSNNCESCKKITWNWITLCLMLIIFMMIALCFSVM